jgi:3-hexulose-6-phosphate synthase
MKLQIALDMLDSDDAIWLAEMTEAFVDIIEIGTPLIKHEGIKVLCKLRKRFADKMILVDLKTMDVGEYEADFCFENGADIVTVLGVADAGTIMGAVKSAKKHKRSVAIDLINVVDKAKKAVEAEELGCDYIAVHTGIDQQLQNQSPLADLKIISKAVKTPIMVAGGIKLETIDLIVDQQPAVVVVGGAITSANDPAFVADKLKQRMNSFF